MALDVGGETRDYTVEIPGLPGEGQVRIEGALQPSRHPPTPQEIADINARLMAMDDPDAPISIAPAVVSPPAPAPNAGDPPIATRRGSAPLLSETAVPSKPLAPLDASPSSTSPEGNPLVATPN